MNDTEKNLQAAFLNLKDTGPIEHTYRIYYDSVSGNCLFTDVKLHNCPHVIVDKKTFDGFNPIFYRIVDGQIKSRQIVYTDRRILVQGDGPYKTIKGASMFLVDNYNGPISMWKVNHDN